MTRAHTRTRTDERLTFAEPTFDSRLGLDTDRYRTSAEMVEAVAAWGMNIATVALRQIDVDDPASRSVLDGLDWPRYTGLPNTAGCATAEEAVRTARLARAKRLSDWVKVEVILDPRYLLPDPIGTFEACRTLIAEEFTVLPYIGADPVLARRLAQMGAATVMPLASPIGSGQGLVNRAAIRIIVEQATVPVVVDAGIGASSAAALAMDPGADACLVNTAIVLADQPALMVEAIAMSVEAGHRALSVGGIPSRAYASASSPTDDLIGPRS